MFFFKKCVLVHFKCYEPLIRFFKTHYCYYTISPPGLFLSMGLVALKKDNNPLMPQMKFGFNTIQID